VRRNYSNAAAIGAMLVAFVLTLEIESILRALLGPGTWLSQLIDDASVNGAKYACTFPTAVLAAWGCGTFARRLSLSLLAGTWLYMIWRIAMQIHEYHVVQGEVGFYLSYFSWTMAALMVWRWRRGIAFECCGDNGAVRARWQFPLRDVFYWTLALAVTLGVGRYAFPAQSLEFEFLTAQQALLVSTQFDMILHCALILPLPLALVFWWRWLPAAALVSIAALVIGVPYHAWMLNVTMLRVIESVPYLASRLYFTSLPIQVLPLLVALRLVGCRLRAAGNRDGGAAKVDSLKRPKAVV
jgi:hypothetical protein